MISTVNKIFLLLILHGFVNVSYPQDSLQFYLSIGLKMDEDKKYSEAEVAFTKALKFDSLSSEAFYYRGVARHKIGEYDSSLTDLDRAYFLNPINAAGLLYNRGLTKYMLSDFKGACEDWAISGKSGFSLSYDAINKYCPKWYSKGLH